jgi:hypothetical protein
MTNSANKPIYQSIYAPASNSPILLESSEYDSLDISTVDSLEINLLSSDADAEYAVQYLMAKSIDEVALADSPRTIISFKDANGFIATGDERDALELAMFESTTLVVKNANN